MLLNLVYNLDTPAHGSGPGILICQLATRGPTYDFKPSGRLVSQFSFPSSCVLADLASCSPRRAIAVPASSAPRSRLLRSSSPLSYCLPIVGLISDASIRLSAYTTAQSAISFTSWLTISTPAQFSKLANPWDSTLSEPRYTSVASLRLARITTTWSTIGLQRCPVVFVFYTHTRMHARTHTHTYHT
jgi:hypothetical protein